MTPGGIEIPTILEDDATYKRYKKMAEEDPNTVLALIARRTDMNGAQTTKLEKRLDAHCNAPAIKAHPPARNNPGYLTEEDENKLDDDELAIKGTLTTGTIFKFVVLIILAASGGVALSWVLKIGGV